MTLIIASQYDVESLPPEIRDLVYPDLLPETLPPPQNVGSPHSPLEEAAPQAPQNVEQSPSTSGETLKTAHSTNEDLPCSPPVLEASIGLSNTSNGVTQGKLEAYCSPQISQSSHSSDLTSNIDPCQSSFKTTSSLSATTHGLTAISNSAEPRANAKKYNFPRTCIFCEMVFSRGYLLDDHLRSHLKETPFECPHCGNGFSVKSCCTNHIKHNCHVRTQERPYVCPICQKSFRTKPNLVAHRYIHLDSNKRTIYPCSCCPSTFKTLSGLNSHTSTKHDKVEHKCNQCGKMFARVSTLHAHTFRHKKIKAHTCLFCDKTFFTNQELFYHLSSHTRERPYPCPKCEKAYKRTNQLQYHMRTAHSSKKDKGHLHSCIFCGKMFVLENRLHSHLYKHIREKWFTCEICGRQFTTRTAMLHHDRQFHKKITTKQLYGNPET